MVYLVAWHLSLSVRSDYIGICICTNTSCGTYICVHMIPQFFKSARNKGNQTKVDKIAFDKS